MKFETSQSIEAGGEWLFALGAGQPMSGVDGLRFVDSYVTENRPPEEAAIVEKARSYGAHAVFFEAARHGRAPVPQAFIYRADEHGDNEAFAALHKRLWSWGGVPLLYRAGMGHVELFRCAHKPDFMRKNGLQVCNPVSTLSIGAAIATYEAWWDASRLCNGTLWDDPKVCNKLLSAHKSAHRTLVEEVRNLSDKLEHTDLLDHGLRRRLLILSLLIAYLEERGVLKQEDFAIALPGAQHFFEVLKSGPAVVALLTALEDRFNGHVFTISEADKETLRESHELGHIAKLIEGHEDSSGQLNLWRLYSFRDLPVELISSIYQLFVTDTATAIYTPSSLVRLMLEETLNWGRLDRLMASDEVILDPACGSGVFLVEAYKRLVLHWRSRHHWKRPDVATLRPLLTRVHGIDVEQGAVELAAFSLCLTLCDALEPEEIRASVKLFPQLDGVTLHNSCFFAAKEQQLVKAPVGIIVGNPPFASELTTEAAKRSYTSYSNSGHNVPDKQLAYLFLHEAMGLLSEGGVLAMIEPAGLLYNLKTQSFRKGFFEHWNVREVLDFVSVRGLFKKGQADPKIVVIVAEASSPKSNDRLLHAVFRRSGRAAAEQGFDVDYYDLYWFANVEAHKNTIWRANLLGGSRVKAFITRLSRFSTLGAYAKKMEWDFGEGFIAGAKGISRPSSHLIDKPLLPTRALTRYGVDTSLLERVPDQPIKDTKTKRRFTPPLLLIKKSEDLPSCIWDDHYVAYKHRIVGFAAPKSDKKILRALDKWINEERQILQAYTIATSASVFSQRANAILSADILALPYPDDQDLELSSNERIVADDIVEFQKDFVRLGADSALMQPVSDADLELFHQTLIVQLNMVYCNKPLKTLKSQVWPGAVCAAYVFGEGDVDWSGANQLRDKLDAVLKEQSHSGITMSRIARVYDENFLFLLKPDRHRFWTRSIALRDSDDVLADLRAQGF